MRRLEVFEVRDVLNSWPGNPTEAQKCKLRGQLLNLVLPEKDIRKWLEEALSQ